MKAQKKEIVERLRFLTNPTLVKVTSIKKKYIEQLSSIAFNPDDLEIIGKCEWKIIVRSRGNGNLYYVHHLKVVEYLTTVDVNENQKTFNEANENAQRVVDSMPQIFQD